MTKKKILIVEDEECLADLLKINIIRRGFDVFAISNGEDALVETAKIKPDIVILDVILPGINGYEVCRKLRANPETEDICIIILTAAAQKEDRIKAKQSGASHYVLKPFDLNELIGNIHKYTGQKN
ncbi:Phosphate regulon transcriptional regulatory protein PhoB (SphR) [Chitinispirillum alkaliphilum]|nr:Phosphate regulon transcriptional regulatory protein PhoB (SphR) [Chitinispirillum alkaliphilum]